MKLRVSKDNMLSKHLGFRMVTPRQTQGNTDLKIIYDAFTVKEVVSDSKEVPVESFAPGVFPVHRFDILGLGFCRFQREKRSNLSVN